MLASAVSKAAHKKKKKHFYTIKTNNLNILTIYSVLPILLEPFFKEIF